MTAPRMSADRPTTNATLLTWIGEMARLCRPDRVVWCDGSQDEKEHLERVAVAEKELEPLDPVRWPGCYYGRSAPNDVARTENLTYICTRRKEDAGPINNWMSPADAYRRLGAIFDGSMRGRTMYVMPFIMGIPGSSFNKTAVQVTDSVYVVLNMRIMTRMGAAALRELGDSPVFTRGLHSKADLSPDHRFICHFPEDNTIWSVGSNYGGNVLLGKKCLALRLASWLGRQEGWLAEHMLIAGIQDPKGRISYIAAAFPSQCGKTNLAMLVPPPALSGYKVWTVGDDIAWLRAGPDGRLYAVNPEAGFFGVAPGTGQKTNPNAMAALRRNTIFTNVLKTDDGGVWWEGMTAEPPASGSDWRGRRWTPASSDKAAHPNSRFTAPAGQCPSISPEWENPCGVPLEAILFGGRRSRVAPLVYQSFDWPHGVYVGATMASETTAAATGKVGVVRRDPMAMLPFCGYDMGTYLAHWLSFGSRLSRPPRIFQVNWFRQDAGGKFIWPGFGENLRVINWIIDRTHDRLPGRRTSIGIVPEAGEIDLTGLDLTSERLQNELLDVDAADWRSELQDQLAFFDRIGPTLPPEIRAEHQALCRRFGQTL